MNNLTTDIKIAASIFFNMWKAKKEGAVKIEKTKQIPLIEVGLRFYDTVEGCTLSHYEDINDIAKKEYEKFPVAIKRKLAFAPKAGEYVDRTILWKETLRPVLTGKQYHTAIKAIIGWYIHIIKLEDDWKKWNPYGFPDQKEVKQNECQ